ncbi:hypothetical protein REH65_33305 (plasmid) [Saccharopolyspora sp. ID03-671]|uniref:hypothetical protein n=1 Tax=Saccharopolyspora sp. ID03-671 TaxID=3073066 RepID=UPI0030F38B3F
MTEQSAQHPLLAYDAADAEHCPACEWIDEQLGRALCPYHEGRQAGRYDYARALTWLIDAPERIQELLAEVDRDRP